MMNFLMLLIAAAGTSSLGACTPATVRPQRSSCTPPGGEQGDFRVCDDGRVLVFPAKHPKSC